MFIIELKERKNISEIRKVNKDKLQQIIWENSSYSDVMRYFELTISGSSLKILKKRIETENLDISHFDKARKEKQLNNLKIMRQNRTISLEEILVKNSSYTNRGLIKKRLIDKGLLEEKCSKCNLGNEWNNQKLTLHLDHINGINNDNRLSNLRLLCPNCHSQTSTYAGKKAKEKDNCPICGLTKRKKSTLCFKCLLEKNSIESIHQRKVKRPSKEELSELIQTKTFSQIGKDNGVSDNAIRKWCKYYDLPYRKKDINNQLIKS